MDPALWPAKDGSSGITAAREMDAAGRANKTIEVGSNFFLFFSSRSPANEARHRRTLAPTGYRRGKGERAALP
jgi:hypothetical protein